MVGGAGNDTYVVDAANDVIVEVVAEGTDLVRTALASFSLNTAALANIETSPTQAPWPSPARAMRWPMSSRVLRVQTT
jgi:hypothetical protein